jgi:hypothetical protein
VTAAELRKDLEAVLAPRAVDAIVRFVEETVRAEVSSRTTMTDRRWLTLPEAAERLGCSPDAVRKRAKRGRLEHRHQGRTLYIAAASIDDLR